MACPRTPWVALLLVVLGCSGDDAPSNGSGAGGNTAATGGNSHSGGSANGPGGAGGGTSTGGSTGGCVVDTDCDDADSCTVDSCDAAMCKNVPGACTGAALLNASYGDSSYQSANAVAADAQGDFVVAATGGSPAFHLGDGVPLAYGAFLAKFDAAHSLVWSYSLGLGAGPQDVAVTANGAVFVTGQIAGTVNLGGGPITAAASADSFVLRLTPGGSYIDAQQFGIAGPSPNGVYSQSIAVDAGGAVAIAGNVYNGVDFGGGLLSPSGGAGGFVAKLDAQGNHVFSHAWPNRLYQSVDIAPNGEVLAAGKGNLTKLDASGNVLFDVVWGEGKPVGTKAVFDAAGDIFVASSIEAGDSPVDFGTGPLTVPSGYNVFVVKLDNAGSVLWLRQLGEINSQTISHELDVDASGYVVVTGIANGGQVSFGGPPIQKPTVNQAMWLAKFSGTDGTHVWSRAQFGPTIYDEALTRGLTFRDGNPLVVGNYRFAVDLGTGMLTCNGGETNSHDFFIAEYGP